MSLEHKINKPKTKRGKRFLENREGKLIENDKRAVFIRGKNANQVVLEAMKDFVALKKPHSIFFNRKNDILPFENVTPLEFFCMKNDAPLFMFGSHNKKKPNNLVIGRMFNNHLLDMFELGMENYIPLKEFKTEKITSGTKPMLLFMEGFENSLELQRLKNLFIDFFRGPVIENVNLQGLEHLLMFSLANNKIHFRSYRVTLNKSNTKSPMVKLDEIGPRMDFALRRNKLASNELFKQACIKKPLQKKPKKIKNIKKDVFGTTQGKIHMTRQDYGRLQTRKVKGLKKRKFHELQESEKRENVSEVAKKKLKT